MGTGRRNAGTLRQADTGRQVGSSDLAE